MTLDTCSEVVTVYWLDVRQSGGTQNVDAESPKPAYMALVRELVKAYQALEGYAFEHIRSLGLTPSQFDVLVALGNQPPMTFKEIGEHTLITKTTLTGVIDRLQERGLVRRMNCTQDRRCTYVGLTPEGDTLFREAFPAHVEYLGQRLNSLSEAEVESAVKMLERFRSLL